MKIVTLIIIIIICVGIVCGNGDQSREIRDQLQDAKTSFSNGDLNTSLKLVNEYIGVYPFNTSAWNLKGVIFLQNGSYKQAEESFLQALNSSPDDPRIYYNLGLAAFNQADLIDAEQYFNRSIAGNYEIPELFFHQGLVQYGLSQYDDSIKSFKKAIELQPEDPAAWLNLGIAYEKIRRFDQAVMAYDKAIEQYPAYAKPWFLKGRIFISFGNATMARSSFENYTRLEPKDDMGWFWYAKSLKGTDNMNESLEALQKAISLNPDNKVYLEHLKIYSGEYQNTMAEFLFTPLSSSYILVILGLFGLLSIIAIIRR